jgi:putative transposase
LRDSKGTVIDVPDFAQNSKKNIIQRQRQWARLKDPKCSYDDRRKRKASAFRSNSYAEIRNRKQDFQHKLANQYLGYDIVFVRKLFTSQQVKKTKLNKLNAFILNKAYSRFISFLKYKLEQQGKRLVEVPILSEKLGRDTEKRAKILLKYGKKYLVNPESEEFLPPEKESEKKKEQE